MAADTMDSLTKFHKEGAMLECLDQEIKRCIRYERSLSILAIELDIPEDVRPDVLYLVLRKTSKIIRDLIRSMDIPARIGDKIYLILPETTPEGAFRVAEKIQEKVEALNFKEEAVSRSFTPSVFIGIANFPQDGKSRDVLYSNSQRALEEAKSKQQRILSLTPIKRRKKGLKPKDETKGKEVLDKEKAKRKKEA